MRGLVQRCAGVLVAAACLAPLAGRADRSDRDQPTLIVADHQMVDDLKQVSVFTGHVVLTKGTIRVTGERMEYREDAEGYQYAVVTASADEPATFHQRRDPVRPGIEETIDGVAQRIEYDNRADTVKLFTNAVVRKFENGALRDEFSGNQIVYDARNSHYDLTGTGTGEGRVVARIAPRPKDEAPKASDGQAPKPADQQAPKPADRQAPKPTDAGGASSP